MKKTFLFLLFAAAAVLSSSCRSVNNVNRTSERALRREGTIIFTRPAQFTPFFGSHSVRQLVEVSYERASRNEAGLLVVEFGVRYRGPVNWTNWHMRAPKNLALRMRCNFYEQGLNSPMVYSTNSSSLVLRLGETYPVRVVCPNPRAAAYQVVLGD